MKAFAIAPFVIFTACMLIGTAVSAQNDYLVTLKGDTLHGEMKLLFYGPEKKVQVKSNGKKEVYSILQTRALFYNNETYHPIKGLNGYTFMKLLTPGYLSLYAFQPENQSNFDGRFLVKADGQSLEVPNLGFKKQMTHFLSDCEGTSAQIEQGELTKKDLDIILIQYNECISNKSKRIKQVITQRTERVEKAGPWDALEEKVQKHADFENKATALEMITDIKSRISRGEKVPNFIVEGLKSTLAAQTDLKEDLDKALSEIK